MLGPTIGFRQRLLSEWSLGYIMGEKSHEKDRTIILRRTEKNTSKQTNCSTHSTCMYMDIGDNYLENITNRYYNSMIQENKKSGL
jgi:hypothetical protein